MVSLKPFDPLFSIHLHGNLTIENDETILIEFEWKDMQNQIVFPSIPEEGRHHDLWRQTCFEAFIRPKIGIGYTEVNLSTTRAWNVYEFETYRKPQPPLESKKVTDIQVHPEKNKISARIQLSDLDLTHIEYSLNAVIVLKNGSTTYWSTHHSQHKPDFHHPDNFILERKHL